jgi:hypothetical protein
MRKGPDPSGSTSISAGDVPLAVALGAANAAVGVFARWVAARVGFRTAWP